MTDNRTPVEDEQRQKDAAEARAAAVEKIHDAAARSAAPKDRSSDPNHSTT